MKRRAGLVSNSSSSSYTCDVCGHTESGFDCELSDFGMFECEHGHTCCDEHHVELTPEAAEELVKMAIEEGWIGEKTAARAEELIKDGELTSDWVYRQSSEIIGERYERNYKTCPICQMTSFTDDDILRYLLKRSGAKRKDIEEEIRMLYPDYDKFIAALKQG